MSRSTLSRPAPWSGLETEVFAEGIYSRHLSDAERVLPVACFIFLGDNPCSLARQGCWQHCWGLVLPHPEGDDARSAGGPT